MAEKVQALEDALVAVGLSALLPRCVGEKIDLNVIREMSDREMIRIGVETIGDRVRLRQFAQHAAQQNTDSVIQTTTPTVITPASRPPSTSDSG